MTITCQYQVWGPDMHAEFAPESICYESCEAPATVNVSGHDSLYVDVFVCGDHTDAALDGLLDSSVQVIRPEFARGYAMAVAEADLVTLTRDHVINIVHSPDGEIPEDLWPRDPGNGEWGDEHEFASWEDEQIALLQGGFYRGWLDRMTERAADADLEFARQHQDD